MANGNETLINVVFNFTDNGKEVIRQVSEALRVLEEELSKVAQIQVPSSLLTAFETISSAALTAAGNLKELSTNSLKSESIITHSNAISESLNKITNAALNAQRALQSVSQSAAATVDFNQVLGQLQKQVDAQGKLREATSDAAEAAARYAETVNTGTRRTSGRLADLNEKFREQRALVRESARQLREYAQSGATDLNRLGIIQKFVNSNQREFVKELNNTRTELQRLQERSNAATPGSETATFLKQRIADLTEYERRLDSLVKRQTIVAQTTASFNTSLSAQQSALTSSNKVLNEIGASTTKFSEALNKLQSSSSGAFNADNFKQNVDILKQLRQELTQVQTQYSTLQSVRGTGTTGFTAQIDQQIAGLKNLEQQLSRSILQAEALNETFERQKTAADNIAKSAKEVSTLSGRVQKAQTLFNDAATAGTNAFGKVTESINATKIAIEQASQQPFITPQAATQLNNLRGQLGTLEAEITRLSSANSKLDAGEKSFQRLSQAATGYKNTLSSLQEQVGQLSQQFAGGRVGGGVRANLSFAELSQLQVELQSLRDLFRRVSTGITGDIAKIPVEAAGPLGKLRNDFQLLGVQATTAGSRVAQSLRAVGDRLKEIGPLGDILAQLGLPAALSELTGRGITFTRVLDRYFDSVQRRYRQTIGLTGELSQALGNFEETLIRFRSGIVTWAIGLQLLGVAASAPFVLAIQNTAIFEDRMRQVQAVTNSTEQEFHALEDVALRMGRTTRFTALEASEGLVALGRAGFDANQAIAALPTTLNLAQAAALDLGKAADIVTNIMTSFELQVSELPRATDVLARAATSSNATIESLGFGFTYIGSLARGLGADFEDLIGSLAKLNNAGFRGTLAGTALRGALDSLFNPTADEARLMEELSERIGDVGLSIRNTNGDFVGFVSLIQQLEAAGFTADEALRLFGQRAGPGVAALLRIGGTELERYVNTLDNAEGTTSEIAATMEKSLFAQFKILISAVEGLAHSIGANLSPVLGGIAKAFATIINAIVEVRELIPPLTFLFDILATTIATATLALGSLAFAWALMIVPAIQAKELLRTFLVPMGLISRQARAGAKEVKGLADAFASAKKTGDPLANTFAAQLSPLERFKNINVIDIVGFGLLATEAGKIYGQTFSKTASEETGKFFKAGIFANLGTVLAEFGRSIIAPIGAAFTDYKTQVTAAAERTGLLSAALLTLTTAGKALLGFFFGGPLRIALTTVVGLLFLFGSNSRVAAAELQKLAGQSQSTGRDIQRLLNSIEQAQQEILRLSETDADTGALREQFKNLNEDVSSLSNALGRAADLGIELNNVRFEPQFDEFGRVTSSVLKFGENFEKSILLGAKSLEEFNKAVEEGIVSIEDYNEVRKILVESFESDQQSRNIQIGVKLSDDLRLINRDLDILRNKIENFSKVGGLTNEESRKLSRDVNGLTERRNELELEIFQTLNFQNLTIEEQLDLINKIEAASGKNINSYDAMDRSLIGISTTLTGIVTESKELNAQLQTFDALRDRVSRGDISKALDTGNLRTALLRASQGVSTIQDRIGTLEEELQKLLEENRDILDEVLSIDETVLDSNLEKIRNGVQRELAVQEEAINERRRQILEEYKNQADAERALTELTLEAELNKLTILKNSYANQHRELDRYLQEAKELVGTENTIEIERNILNRRKELLEEELDANRSVISAINKEREDLIKANNRSIQNERDTLEQISKIQREIRNASGFVSERSQFLAERADVDTQITAAKLALASGDYARANELIQKGIVEAQEAISAIPSDMSEIVARFYRSGISSQLDVLAQLQQQVSKVEREVGSNLNAKLGNDLDQVRTRTNLLNNELDQLSAKEIDLAGREKIIKDLQSLANSATESDTVLEALTRRLELLKTQSDRGVFRDEENFLGIKPQSILDIFEDFKSAIDAFGRGEVSLDTFQELFGDINELKGLRELLLEISGVDIFGRLLQGQEGFFAQLERNQDELRTTGVLSEESVRKTLDDLQTILTNIQALKPALDSQSTDVEKALGIRNAANEATKLGRAQQTVLEVTTQLANIREAQTGLKETEDLRANYANISRLLSTIITTSQRFNTILNNVQSGAFEPTGDNLRTVQTTLRDAAQQLEQFLPVIDKVGQSTDDAFDLDPDDFQKVRELINAIATQANNIDFTDPEATVNNILQNFGLLVRVLGEIEAPTSGTFDVLEKQVQDALVTIINDLNLFDTKIESLKDINLGEAKLSYDDLEIGLKRFQADYNAVKQLIETEVPINISAKEASDEIQVLETELLLLKTRLDNDTLADIDLNNESALKKIEEVENRLEQLQRAARNTNISIGAGRTGGLVQGFAQGGLIKGIQRFAQGGLSFARPNYSVVPGAGSGDKIPALLEPGEFIIRKSSVQRFGVSFFNALNQGLVQMKALGGYIHSVPNALSSVNRVAPIQRFANGGVARSNSESTTARNLGTLTLATPDGRAGPTLYGDVTEIKTFLTKLGKKAVI